MVTRRKYLMIESLGDVSTMASLDESTACSSMIRCVSVVEHLQEAEPAGASLLVMVRRITNFLMDLNLFKFRMNRCRRLDLVALRWLRQNSQLIASNPLRSPCAHGGARRPTAMTL
jgi:hypothetical protein